MCDHSRPCLQCIVVLISLLYTSSAEHLEVSLRDVPFSSFVKTLLHDDDVDARAAGIVFSQLLLSKICRIFVAAFVKEGTYVALKKLAASAPPPPKPQLQVRVPRHIMSVNLCSDMIWDI